MKKSLLTLSLALFYCVGTPAQTIKADTLQDLKAEYEYQKSEVMPVVILYKEAQDKRLACAKAQIAAPLETDCTREARELRIIEKVGEAPMNKYVAAKEAYERELRKVGRK